MTTQRPADPAHPAHPSHPAHPTRRSALALAAVGVLAGCGFEPDRTIRPGLDVDAPQQGLGPNTYVPPGPQAGDGPVETILGFMRAGRTTGSQLDIARSFLTQEAGDAWLRSDAQTVVYESGTSPRVVRVAGDRWQATVRTVAVIDPQARYSVAPANDYRRFEFGMRQEEGRWVIAKLPEGFGRVLPRQGVNRMYRAYPVHYTSNGYLVADLRWIPQDQETTRLTAVQLGSVPDHLVGAVSTDDEAELSVRAVPVVDGVAQVDLDTASPEPAVRKQLAAQLVATLRKLGDVTEVDIRLGGSPLPLPDVETPLSAPEQLGFVNLRTSETRVLARLGTRLVDVPPGTLSTVTGDELRRRSTPFAEVPRSWRRLGLSPDGKEVAGVGGDGVELTRWRDDGTQVAVRPFATEMTRPVYDVGSVLWVGGQGLGEQEGLRLWAINARADTADPQAAAPLGLRIGWLDGRLVRAIGISPEGSRIAVISAAPKGGSVLEVAGIARGANGLPTGIATEPLRVAARFDDLRDLVWVGQTQLAVVGRLAGRRTLLPYLADVGGDITELTARAGGVEITTADSTRDIVLSDGRGRCWIKSGTSWRELTEVDQVITTA